MKRRKGKRHAAEVDLTVIVGVSRTAVKKKEGEVRDGDGSLFDLLVLLVGRPAAMGEVDLEVGGVVERCVS